jgi:hypothetical protein
MPLTIWLISADINPPADTPLEPSVWLTPLIAIAALLIGGGGVASWYRIRVDKALGVASQEVNEDDALVGRWERIIKAQTESLVQPLQTRLKEVEDKVQKLELELTVTKTKYWRAIAHIRSLISWIKHHASHVEAPTPTPPMEIIEDI